MINDDITISKGAYSVTMFTTTSAENFKNTMQIIPPLTTPKNQANGVKLPTVVDLLRITHTFSFECYITPSSSKTAKEIKDDLKAIFNGANVDSVPAVLTYEDGTYNVFPEDVVIKKINNDNVIGTSYSGLDNAEYHVTLSVVEGKLVGS